jgi:hypothetical protein
MNTDRPEILQLNAAKGIEPFAIKNKRQKPRKLFVRFLSIRQPDFLRRLVLVRSDALFQIGDHAIESGQLSFETLQ